MKSLYAPEYRHMLTKLREAREKEGLSQAQVAAHFSRPQSFVSKCESGERRIDPTELKRFAALYGRPVSYFLEQPCEGVREEEASL